MNRDVFICDEQTRRIHFQNIQSTMTKDSRLKVKFVSANNAVAKARAFFRSLELKPHRDKRTLSPLIVDSPPPRLNEDYQLITPPISKIDQINPRDLIVHRVINIDDKLPLNYFQQKYKQYLKPSLLIPRQYYNDLLNKRYYSSYTGRHAENKDKLIIDFHPPPPSVHYRPSSSASTWEQCVRRLNTEYRLTIDALEQAKECLKHTYSQPKPSLNPNKRSGIVTFDLPPPPKISDHIEQSKIPPCIKFSPPKFIKPVQLDTFPLSSALTIIENDADDADKIESVSNIIKKFNSLSPTISNPPPRVHFQPSVMTYEIPKEEPIMIPVQDKQINSKKFISRIPTKINSSNKQKSSTATTTTTTTMTKTRIPIKNSRISRPSAVQHK